MKKIFLILLLSLFSSSVNAGLKEIGSSYVSQETKDKINIQFEENKSKKKNKKLILYFYTDGQGDHIWHWGSAKEITDKLHKKVFKNCNKQIKKYVKKEGECSLYVLDNKVVWDFIKVDEKQLVKKNTTNAVLKGRCYNPNDAIPVTLDSDKKLGRFFEDQPDVNDDYQVHIIYSLLKNSKDKEGDINGAIEKWIETSDKFILKTTKKANKKSNFKNGVAQNIKWDRRQDGKLDISFIRINKTNKELDKSKSGSCGNIFGRTILNAGFDNPKKIYLNFGDFSFKEGAYSGGFPIFSIFSKYNRSTALKKSDIGYAVLHEGLHAMGGIFPCAPNFSDFHTRTANDLMGAGGNGNPSLDPKNDDYWGHNNKNCPDMQDSVYFTPTSDTPFDPFEVTCLPKEKWKLTKHDYKNIVEEFEGEGCFYTRPDVTAPWKKELGIFKDAAF